MANKPVSALRVLLEAYLCVSALLLVGFLLSLAMITLGWRQGDVRELVLDVLRAELLLSGAFGVIALSAGLLMLRDAIVARWKDSGAEHDSHPSDDLH
jgi:hypothetical protein